MTGRHSPRAVQARARRDARGQAPAAAGIRQVAGAPLAGPGGAAAAPPAAAILPAPAGSQPAAAARPGWRHRAVRLAGGSPMTAAALAVLIGIMAFCFAGPLVYHSDLARVNLAQASRPPGPGHPLGTDADGIDVLGRLMAGGQISLLVGIAAGLLSAVIGSLWGAVAGYLGGIADALMMRAVDAVIAVPAIVVVLLLVAAYRPSPALLVIVIAATSWLGTARLVRGETLTLRAREYVQAVRTMGGGRVRAVLRHIAPNASGTIIVNVSFQVADAVLVLATLSYLSLGVQPPSSDWGDMIASGVKYIYDGYWWEIYPPGIAIIAFVVACHLLGDGLRDRLQPRRPGAGPG